jgi:hypothetical protein
MRNPIGLEAVTTDFRLNRAKSWAILHFAVRLYVILSYRLK